ncbi:MAG TPA: YceI family protein [Thermomicrobiaceae bacterium]|nr:YceI family protein [Thermomicrobiaceae bacterium]
MYRLRMSLVILICCALIAVACGSSSTSSSSGAASIATSAATTATTGVVAGSATADAATATTSAGTTSSSPSTNATTGTASTESSDASQGDSTYTLVSGKNTAEYEAHEQLAFLTSPSAAVGKTEDVTGQLVFNEKGEIESARSKITVDLSTLKSDKSMRDNYIKQNTLQTDTYPDAVLVPTAVQGLSWPLPTSGQATFTLIGNLTVRGVTKQTSWKVTATFGAQQVSGKATTTVTFEDFGMSPPTTMIALSVQDSLKLEIDFVVQKAS